jgi:hypothetical protein
MAALLPAVVTVRALMDDMNIMKDVFILARRLRDCGFIAEISLNGNISVGAGWVVDIIEESGQLTITDLADNRRYEISDLNEAVKFMEGRIGREAGPA